MIGLRDWQEELPAEPGFYLWWEAAAAGLAGIYPGPCAGLVEIVEVPQGYGWPVKDKYFGMIGSSLPQLLKDRPKTLWSKL